MSQSSDASLGRRGFLRAGTTALGAAALAPLVTPNGWVDAGVRSVGIAKRLGLAGTDVRIEVLPAEPIAPVTSSLYGHFIEHLGGVIYDGVWVGEDSKIPNVGGIRKALLDDLRALTPGVVRWPGGCFADSYDWMDGVGPRDKRPRRASFWASELPASVAGPARYEPNHFGTQEFLRFCQYVGAEPYLAVNARGRTAQDFAQWVEYCNAPAGSTTLAAKRAADGSVNPFNVRYWGVGNEPWGCGGNLSPEEYAEEYRRFTAMVPKFPGDKAATTPRLVAAGPLEDDADEAWTRRFLASMAAAGRGDADLPFGYSIHSYFFRHDAFNFTPAGWYTLLSQPHALGSMLDRQARLLRTARTPITLVLDEWGPWYSGDTGQTDPSHLFEQVPTLRDALVTALAFDTFHAHADVLSVATVAQTVNCIHSLFLTQGEQCIRTPVYHAFALYQPHIGGTAVRTVATADPITFTSDGRHPAPSTIDGVSASATLHTGDHRGHVVVTVTNPRIDQPVTATISLRGTKIRSGDVTVLTHADPHAKNTFAAPSTVQLGATTALKLASSSASDAFTLTLPAASVTRVVCVLGA